MDQSVFRTNLDYDSTWRKAQHHPDVLSLETTEKGLIMMTIRGSETKILISPKGTIQFAHTSHEERRRINEVLNTILVPEQGNNLTVKLTYELERKHYAGCTPEQEFGALTLEIADKISARPFFRRKRIGKIITALSTRKPLLQIREDRPILNVALERINIILESVENVP